MNSRSKKASLPLRRLPVTHEILNATVDCLAGRQTERAASHGSYMSAAITHLQSAGQRFQPRLRGLFFPCQAMARISNGPDADAASAGREGNQESLHYLLPRNWLRTICCRCHRQSHPMWPFLGYILAPLLRAPPLVLAPKWEVPTFPRI